MPKIIIDGQEIESRENIPVLQAALEAGLNVAHYCYHPGLSIVASCRLCLMEMKLPHPRTKEPGWAPKLFPSCQTFVRDGMEVRFDSTKVDENKERVMEYYLLNHPLDCPVCDKAGECYLQDYSEEFGTASSRMVEDKVKNPKKDIGPETLLYQDRCVLCTRCVRFADEVAGDGELTVVNRGNRGEIDVFPGEPLDNPLQGNVVDICPVGALLSKDFLFQQRVWLLKSTKSISPADSSGAAIWVDHNVGQVYRIRPRFNERVNEWWISDEQRFDYKYVHRDDRLDTPQIREHQDWKPLAWQSVPELLTARLQEASGPVAAVLSPMMSCEEAFLLATFIRKVAPEATLVLGYVPIEGEDQTFPKGFTIRAEKCPNRRGIETLLEHFGGATATWAEFCDQANAGKVDTAFVTGGYSHDWLDKASQAALRKVRCVMMHDLFASPIKDHVALQIPSASWVEREGSFMNHEGLLQAFERAIPPREGVKFDGQFFAELAEFSGLFKAAKVRAAMAEHLPVFAEVFEPRPEPEHAH